MKRHFGALSITLIFVAGAAIAADEHAGHHATPATPATPATIAQASASAAPMTEGEVRKVDKEQGKITLKHGEIKNLDMPGMTMVFRVKDAAILDQVKEGDQILFTAEKPGGQFTVTAIQKK